MMPAFQKYANFQKNFALKKKLVEGFGLREVPRGIGPWLFLVPPILVK
jgi:hypothetical protein